MSVDADKSFANLSLKHKDSTLSGVDRALLLQLVYGTVAHQISLDYILNQYLKKPLCSMPVPMRNILRMGAYQLLYLDKIPARAAVDEAVKLAHKFGHRGTVGLVNAVLRKVSEAEITWPDPRQDIIEHLSVRYSHPAFLVKRYVDRYGVTEAESLLNINNQPARLSVRVNTLQTTVPDLVAHFASLGITASPGVYVPEILNLSSAPDFSGLAFAEGQFIVQGEASALCAHFLAPKPGDTVIDLCAAPGGKTTHIAEKMRDIGTIYAFDISPARLGLVTQNAKRLRLSSIKTVAARAQEAHTTIAKADRVLLDAPCSGFGVIRHKPDIRLNRSEVDIVKLATLQRELLSKAAELVRYGGTLVYSVCTTEPEETTEIVEWFLRQFTDFSLAPPPAIVNRGRDESLGCLFLPTRDSIDGFYIASFVRAGN